MPDYQKYQNRRRRGKVFFGALLVVAGIIVLLKTTGVLPYFDFSTLWPYALIALGLFTGIKHGFRNNAPYILIAIGLFNAIPAFDITLGNKTIASENLVIPLLVIGAGLLIIFKPRGEHCMRKQEVVTNPENSIEMDVVFGGRKEIITSKEFNGGRVTATFGGCEINMLQADSSASTIVLDVRTTFGGCEIIVPANWEVRNEIVPVFGSVEDQRTLRMPEQSGYKISLILKGSCVFGGVEIKSF